MKLQGNFLTSRLARRIFVMFSLAVLVPGAAAFWLTYENAAELTRKSESSALRAANKHFAMGVFDRLQLAKDELTRLHPAAGIRSHTNQIFTNVHAPDIAQLGLMSANGSKALVSLDTRQGRPRVELTVHSSVVKKPVTGTLDPAFVFGGSDEAIENGQVCIYSGDTLIGCAGSVATQGQANLVRDEWDLFLMPNFGAKSWRFVALRPSDANFDNYAKFLLPLGAGMLLLALLLSSVEIRRILVPLESLLMRIRAVGGATDAPGIATNDEFAMLDQTFSAMERRISQQLTTLETLQRIDRLILERTPVSDVVQVVLARIQQMTGAEPIALTLADSQGHEPLRHFMVIAGPAGEPAPVASVANPVGAPALALTPDTHWQTAQEVGPGFAGLHIQQVSYMTVGQPAGAIVRIAIGDSQRAIESDVSGEIRELVGRVAVAMTAAEHESRLLFQARHDLLTGLPNRLSVIEQLDLLLSDSSRAPSAFATMFIDLDRFKAINDGLGHELGDAVLREVSRRFSMAAGSNARVARIGGDEFFMVMPEAASPRQALEVDRALRDCLVVPVFVEGRALTIGFSAGVAMHPGGGSDSQSLIENADIAMYRAKRSGGGRTLIFAEEMNSTASNRIQMETDLRAALGNQQLHLHYQPRVDSRDQGITGVEALARWSHPTRGMVPANEFINVAEECGLIVDLGEFVIREACRQLAAWKQAGIAMPVMAVNVSPQQLRPGNLFQIIGSALSENQLGWHELEIEITESLLVRDEDSASSQLRQLRDAGCTVAIDDFGTGFSSLAYLTRLPSDTIKIDRTFIQTLHEPETQVVVRSILAMAQALKKKVVAEGVETMDDVALLNSWDCFIIQGYVYFKPLAPAELAKQLNERADQGSQW